MSTTVPSQCSIPTLVFNATVWDSNRSLIQQNAMGAVLPCILYGIFILLCGASIYSLALREFLCFVCRSLKTILTLIHRPSNRNQRTTLVLGLTILTLFSSTTIYTIGALLAALEQMYIQTVNSWELWGEFAIDFGQFTEPVTSPITQGVIYCAPTASLTINILLGDAIVCWRACVFWRGNRIVTSMCIVLLLATFAMGIVDSTFECTAVFEFGEMKWQPDPHADGLGMLYSGFSYGVAATALSLCTNLFATLAVAMKAWHSRRVLKQYVVIGTKVSQMQKVLLLLMESGIIYCTLWVIILAWQAGAYNPRISWIPGDNSFWNIINDFVNLALVPIIAIYPTIIIILVARLDRSHIELGFTKMSLATIY